MVAKLINFFKQPAILSSAIATVLLLGIQKLGVLEGLELKAYDQMMQMRADSGPDNRLLIIAVTEQDIKKLNWPLSGEVLDRVLGRLEEYEPRVIGLDIFRDLPVEPGHETLLKRLQESDTIIPICKHIELSDRQNSGTPPPQGIEVERVGFSDVVEDSDNIIRRNLLLANPEPNDSCQSNTSFGLQLALRYLEVGGIKLEFTPNRELKLRDVVFQPLQSNYGGYQQADTKGYQILLNFRSQGEIARKVSVSDVLDGQIKPEWVKDRIVLIGSTASSLKDIFYTPFTSGKSDNSGKMPGVEIHAHSISQILSAVLNKHPLFWFLPEWGEMLWIWGWTVVGGLLVWRIQHPLALGLTGGTALLLLVGGNFFIFTQGGWFPVVAPGLGLVLTAGSTLAYSAYQTQQEHAKIRQKLQEQQELIARLQALAGHTGATMAPGLMNNIGEEIPLNTILNKRYKIIERLSGGGFSNTYVAQDIQNPSQPKCVVKQLRPPSQETEYLNILRRLFKTEAEILAILGKHPQIPELIASFEENRQFSIVQELIKGNPLNKELVPGKRLTQTETVTILKEVLQVLVFVHSYGVIHRDIKPGNLIRRESDGRIVLIDFGAVKQIKPQQPENQTIAIGTPSYAPTEQMSGLPKLNSDIYALGMLGIQALTGVDPRTFERDISSGIVIIQAQPPTNPPTWLNWRDLSEATSELAAVLDKMVDLDFTKRYQSAIEVFNILENLS